MFVKNIHFFILSLIYTYINTQQQTQLPSELPASQVPQQPQQPTLEQIIAMCQQICMPIPQCIDMNLFERIEGYDCKSLLPYPNTENMTFRCCEIEFHEEKNSSAPLRHGCLGILPNYIDDNRYEDIIDWIERGKADKIEEYTVYLGKTAHDAYLGFIKNETEYIVNKLDCLTKFIFPKYFIISILGILLL